MIGAQTPHRLAAIALQPQADPPRVHVAPGPFRRLLGEDAWLTLPLPVQKRFERVLAPYESAVFIGEVASTRLSVFGRLCAQLARPLGAPLPRRASRTRRIAAEQLQLGMTRERRGDTASEHAVSAEHDNRVRHGRRVYDRSSPAPFCASARPNQSSPASCARSRSRRWRSYVASTSSMRSFRSAGKKSAGINAW